MKKIMKPFVLVAAAAMALASCQKNEIPAPEKQDVHFTINAGIETKTSIVESTETDENGKPIYHAQWDGNEELGVLFAAPTAETTASNVVRLTNAVSGRTASFQGDVTLDKLTGTFYAFYPAEAFNKGYADGDARLDLKNVQKPTATSFDPLCDILVAKPYEYEVVDGKVVADGLEFARLMSVLRIDLKSEFTDIQNEFVESVSFTAGDVEITGYARVFLDNPKFDKWASNGAQCTVTANYDSDLVSINGTSNSVYLVIAPVTIPANKDLTFEIKTKNYNISKTIKSPEMKFTAGKVSKINLTIVADNCDKIDTSIDYSGEWLITGVNDSQTYAVSAYVDGNNLDVLVPIAVADEKITEVDGLANCKMTITKVLDGDYAGMYTIEDANSTEQKRSYLYAAGTGTNNHLKAGSTLSAGSYWDITKNDNGTYTIIASKHTSDRNTIWYNTTNNIFSCYQSNSASYKPITLYPYSMVVPDTTPRILVEETAYNVLATDTSVEIPYTVKNITGTISATVADDATMTNASASVVGNNVKVTFDANEAAEAKTATIVLSYEGAQDVNVVITQEAAGATKQYYVKVTSAPTDWSGTYLIVAGTSVATVIDGSWMKYVTTTINDNKIEATATINAYAVTVAKVTSQSYYTIKLANGQYLGTPSSNGIKQSATVGADFYWKFSISSDLVKIEANAYSGRILRLNGTSGFRTYTSSTGTQATLYRLEGGESGGETPEQPETPATPVLTIVEKPTSDIAAEGDVVTVKYSVTNPVEGKSVTASANKTWVNGFDYSVAGEVSFIVEENAGVARTATVTLAYEGATSQTVTISQAAAQSGGNEGGAGTVLYSEDFSSLISWSTSNVRTVTVNNVVYTSAGGNMYAQNGCLKFGKSSGAQNVGVKLPTISSLSSATNVILKFKAVSSDASYTLSVTGTGCTVGTLSPSAITKHSTSINDGANTQKELQKAFDNSQVFSVDITGMTSSSVISIVASGSAKRWYIDDIEIIVN